MSWTICLVESVEGGEPLGSRAEVVARLAEVEEDIVWEEASFGVLERDGVALELDLGQDEPVRMVSLSSRGAEPSLEIDHEHLDFLEEYVSAKLRERTPNHNGSLASRLPRWMKAAGRREQVLAGIEDLRRNR